MKTPRLIFTIAGIYGLIVLTPFLFVERMIADIAEKLESGERLSLEDGVRLFEHPDLLEVGSLANRQRER